MLTLEQYIDDDDSGLLFVPGKHIDDNVYCHDNQRGKNENCIFSTALRHGCPILAVCQGAISVWQHLQGTESPVKFHSYSQMPRITTKGAIGCNKTMHRLKVTRDSLLEAAMGGKDRDRRNIFIHS